MQFLAIYFPQLDPSIIEFGPFSIGSVEIGPLAIRWYALSYIAGLVLGWRYIVHLLRSDSLWKKSSTDSRSKLQPPAAAIDIDDLLVWITLGVIVGGRLGYVLFYQSSIILEDPLDIFAVWKGGMSFHGGFIGVIVAGYAFCRKRGLDVVRIGDLVASAAPIGLFFGRIANFINSELWGRETTVPWGVIFPNGGPEPRHPSQLYEATLEGLFLFFVLRFATHRIGVLNRPGTNIGLFLAGYGFARIVVEFFREPDSHIGYLAGDFLTMGMILSTPMVLGGILLIWHSADRAGQLPSFSTKTRDRKK